MIRWKIRNAILFWKGWNRIYQSISSQEHLPSFDLSDTTRRFPTLAPENPQNRHQNRRLFSASVLRDLSSRKLGVPSLKYPDGIYERFDTVYHSTKLSSESLFIQNNQSQLSCDSKTAMDFAIDTTAEALRQRDRFRYDNFVFT